MRNEYAVDYQYAGKWIEFSRHTNKAEAEEDVEMLRVSYDVRVRKLHPQSDAQ